MVRPIEPLLPNNSGYNYPNMMKLCAESGRDHFSICQLHVVGEVLAMTDESSWDEEEKCFWLRLRDEGNFGEQWLRQDGYSLGLGIFLEALPAGAPGPDVREGHRKALSEVRGVRSAFNQLRDGEQGQAWQEVPRLSITDAMLGQGVQEVDSDEARQILDGPAISHLLREGFLVIHDALDEVFASEFAEQMAKLDNGWNLHAAPQATPGQRGDRLLWIDEEIAVARYGSTAVSRAIRLLKGLGAALNPALTAHHWANNDAGNPAHALKPRLPATDTAVLTVSPKAQLACYPCDGAHYICHQDNKFRPTHGTRLNSRELTTILYGNATDWDVCRDGGQLKLYLQTEDLESAPPSDHPSVHVAPTVGTLVIFFSRLWHEVLPAYRPRRALTMWILRPEEEESWMPNVF
ncbi:egl-9 [Symbiodinium natans]|uniref:Egl-9 protein n=1 Tax=Symbiodinium natans TaxID=878477 RepID=A0A812LBY1_9DINO|nr:egl-9 [Symbiodinium natans]